MSYQVDWEIRAVDLAAGFLRDDPAGVAALWETVRGGARSLLIRRFPRGASGPVQISS